MLIKFHILWIEDDERTLQTTGKALEQHLESLGFSLEIDHIQNPITEEDQLLKFLDHTAKYDLILVDWKFKTGAGQTDEALGGDAIEKIRSYITFSDIIFYSGDMNFEGEFNRRNLQGVYIVHRSDLKDEAKDLINYLLHKTLHPKIMRGIVVSELSYIDDLCYRIIEKKYNCASGSGKPLSQKLKTTLEKQYKKQYEDRIKKVNKSDDEFVQEIHSTVYFDSYKRSLEICDLANTDGLEKSLLEPIRVLPETIKKRNMLAHWKRIEETDTHIVLRQEGKDDYIFDQDEAINIRKSINNAAQSLSAYLDIT